MKIVKSKLSIAILSLGFVSAIGAVAYATLNRPFTPTTKSTDVKLAKKVEPAPAVAPHQQEVKNYLDEMKSYLQTPPRDGVFGSDRIPTLHGKESSDIPAYEAVRQLEGSIKIRSAVLGLEPASSIEVEKQVELAKGVKLKKDPSDYIRLSDVHYASTQDGDEYTKSPDLWNIETKTLQKFAVEMRKKGLDEDVQEVKVGGKKSWIVAKAVHASVNSCYKCHTNVKKGEAIGYVAALVSEDK